MPEKVKTVIECYFCHMTFTFCNFADALGEDKSYRKTILLKHGLDSLAHLKTDDDSLNPWIIFWIWDLVSCICLIPCFIRHIKTSNHCHYENKEQEKWSNNQKTNNEIPSGSFSIPRGGVTNHTVDICHETEHAIYPANHSEFKETDN